MADNSPQDRKRFSLNLPSAAEDYQSVLSKVIGEASRDPAQLRKLVYALAWNYLKPNAGGASHSRDAKQQAKATFELELAKLQLQRAIETIETDVTHGEPTSAAPPGEASTPQSGASYPFADGWHVVDSHPRDLDENHPPPDPAQPEDHRSEAPADNAVIILPERAPAWLVQRHELYPDHDPPWDPRYESAFGRQAAAPAPRGLRTGLMPFLQLVAAAFIGVVLYVGVAGWIQIGRQTPTASSQVPPAPPRIETTARAPIAAAEVKPPAPDPTPSLPFPLPRAYGVYAASDGRLAELAQLPIKVPDPRVHVSAEITRPSRTTLSSGDLSFIIFRRDLVNSAPQMVPVRVVARVSREMKFVYGKPTVSEIEGAWRIRTKGYELKVEPVEGRPEMILLQPEPGFVFPPGRYALVLNGFGFDFAVEGTINSPEQCLEQAEMVNGTILNECPKIDEPQAARAGGTGQNPAAQTKPPRPSRSP